MKNTEFDISDPTDTTRFNPLLKQKCPVPSLIRWVLIFMVFVDYFIYELKCEIK